MRKQERFSLWQSFSDLAMGLMAIFALILMILINQVSTDKEQLEEDRKEFLEKLVQTMEETFEIYESQNGVHKFINAILSQHRCKLQLKEDGTLVLDTESEAPADLYRPDRFHLNREGEKAIKKCASNFELMAKCLSPDPKQREDCKVATNNLKDEEGNRIENIKDVATQFREGIEALVLQGNTDAQGTRQRTEAILRGGYPLYFGKRVSSFVGNAYLGAERARQALGHLLFELEKTLASNGEGQQSPVEILMSRIRVESASYGRFQAGPIDFEDSKGQQTPWRAASKIDGKSMPYCEGNGSCPEARRLILSLRWRPNRLREPFYELNENLCDMLESEYLKDAFKGKLAGKKEAQLKRCDALKEKANRKAGHVESAAQPVDVQ